jgi:hypothetical protein
MTFLLRLTPALGGTCLSVFGLTRCSVFFVNAAFFEACVLDRSVTADGKAFGTRSQVLAMVVEGTRASFGRARLMIGPEVTSLARETRSAAAGSFSTVRMRLASAI